MNDDELIERLRDTLSTHAATVTSAAHQWEAARQPADHIHPLYPPHPRYRRWLPGSAVAVALAVAAAALFVVWRSPDNKNSKVSLVAPATGSVPATIPSASSTPATASGPATTLAPPSGPAGGPVPKAFSPASVTFVSARAGWVLGTAPCSSPPCTSVVRTSDGGRTWVGIPAPRTTLAIPPGSPGVSFIRFANAEDGWAFGTELWVTHDGGGHWNKIVLPGAAAGSPILDLEAGAGLVHAVVAGDNANFLIETSPVGGDNWTASATELPVGAGPVPTVEIVLQGHTGWVLENDRTVIAGARLAAQWVPWQPPCQASGGPAALTASSPTELAAVCNEGVWSGPGPTTVRAYLSTDGGTSFHPTPTPPGSSYLGLTIAATPSPRTIIFGSYTQGGAALVGSFDGGGSWAPVSQVPGPGQWLELGFTSPTQGVAVDYHAGSQAALLMTYDGGHTWAPVTFRQG